MMVEEGVLREKTYPEKVRSRLLSLFIAVVAAGLLKATKMPPQFSSPFLCHLGHRMGCGHKVPNWEEREDEERDPKLATKGRRDSLLAEIAV